jgi:PAS domain S-box-containing protein
MINAVSHKSAEEFELELSRLQSELDAEQQAIRQLKDNNENLLQLANVYGYIAFVNAETLRYEYVNKSFENAFRIPTEKIIGKHISEILGEKNYQFALKYINEARTGKPATYENTFEIASGKRWMQVNYLPILDDIGVVKTISVVSFDITKRKEADEALRQSEAKYRLLTEFAGDVIWVLNVSNAKFTYVSPAVFQLRGITAEEAIMETMEDSMTPESVALVNNKIIGNLAEFTLYPENPNTYITEVQQYCKNGDIIWVEVSTKFRYNTAGETEIIGVSRDITMRKHMEQELFKAKEKAEESDRLKTAFLQNMSHEIRTPMNGILGFAELLKSPNLKGEKQQEFIGIIEKSGQRMLNTINSIIEISKIEAGKLEVNLQATYINEQIENIFSFFQPEAEKKGLQLSYRNSLTSKEACILTDPEKFYSIMLNLVKNAIKFTDTGTIEIGYQKNEKILEFFVKDTGIGIPKDRHVAIFEPFIQADINDSRAYQGNGLGLSIAYNYVKILGGEIRVHSETGKGAAFYFTLPYHTIPIEIPKNNYPEAFNGNKKEMKKLNILIVEDDETSRFFLSEMLNGFSNKIIHAKTGLEAIRMCQNNKDLDLVLMDIRMPEMDGHEATRHIRRFNKDLTIIAQTAHGLSGDREKAIDAGCTDYISKPVRKGLLMEMIDKHFISHQ